MNQRTVIFIGAAVLIVAAIAVTVTVVVTTNKDGRILTPEERVQEILKQSPIIDGHNDFPYNLRRLAYNDLNRVNFSTGLANDPLWGPDNSSHTDIPRLRQGGVGAQFWVAYTKCESQFKDSVEQTLEQIDVIHRMAAKYPESLAFATSAQEIEDAMARDRIASLVAVEGGHSMQFSMGILRMLYSVGTRYMTLTHSCNTPWADASPVDAQAVDPGATPVLPEMSDGLTPFGEDVVREMNRLGMMVDLSHVSKRTMEKALNVSRAPVIFSHSSAYAICNHHRNVQDDILQKVKETNSLVMVNFYKGFVKCGGGPANISDVVEHIEHIRNITGPDHVGIGGDYDGVEAVPEGLEDVSKYPALFKALVETGRWSDEDLMKLSGRNLLRVFRAVEKVRDDLKDEEPRQEWLKEEELEQHQVGRDCITTKFESNQPAPSSGQRRRRSVPEESDL